MNLLNLNMESLEELYYSKFNSVLKTVPKYKKYSKEKLAYRTLQLERMEKLGKKLSKTTRI